MRFVLYRRVSTKEQGDSGAGLEAQRTAMHAFCVGHDILAEFEDVASGRLPPDVRPGLSQALEAVRRHKGSALLVSKLDRLSRDMAVTASLMDRVPFFTVEHGLTADRTQLHIYATFADMEARKIGERTRVALAAKRAAGVALGMHSHASPQVSGERARKASAVAVRADADAYARHVAPTLIALKRASLTLAEIAGQLNTLRVPTPRGGEWSAPRVCNLLARIARIDAQA